MFKRHAFKTLVLTAALVAASRDGRTVVRLLPGDPFLHAEGAKEAEAVLKAKLRLEVVPGVPQRGAVPPIAASWV